MRFLLLKRVIEILFLQREDGAKTPQISRRAVIKGVYPKAGMTLGVIPGNGPLLLIYRRPCVFLEDMDTV